MRAVKKRTGLLMCLAISMLALSIYGAGGMRGAGTMFSKNDRVYAQLEAAASNLVVGNFDDTFATGMVLKSHANGVQFVTDSSPKRATLNVPLAVDGLVLRFSDIALAPSGYQGVAFTMTTSSGHYYGAGTNGVHFRLYNGVHEGENSVFFIIKQGAASDYDEKNVYLQPTVLSGLGSTIPADLEFKFTKVADDFLVSVNGIEVSVPAESILSNIFVSKKALITFGGYCSSEMSFVVNHAGQEADTAVNGNGNPAERTIKILAIGNSFSVDAGAFFADIARADNIQIILGIASIGGGTLQDQWNAINEDRAVYQYRLTDTGMTKDRKLTNILADDDWEYIVLQQASHYSGMYETFQPYLADIAGYLTVNKPDAEIVMHQTWAYDENAAHSGYANYNNSQKEMYEGIVSSYNQAAQSLGARLIPCGDAFQNARKDKRFDVKTRGKPLTADGYHASALHGRYLLASVWYEFFTGNSILDNDMTLIQVSADELASLKNAAHQAGGLYDGGGKGGGCASALGSNLTFAALVLLLSGFALKIKTRKSS